MWVAHPPPPPEVGGGGRCKKLFEVEAEICGWPHRYLHSWVVVAGCPPIIIWVAVVGGPPLYHTPKVGGGGGWQKLFEVEAKICGWWGPHPPPPPQWVVVERRQKLFEFEAEI